MTHLCGRALLLIVADYLDVRVDVRASLEPPWAWWCAASSLVTASPRVSALEEWVRVVEEWVCLARPRELAAPLRNSVVTLAVLLDSCGGTAYRGTLGQTLVPSWRADLITSRLHYPLPTADGPHPILLASR